MPFRPSALIVMLLGVACSTSRPSPRSAAVPAASPVATVSVVPSPAPTFESAVRPVLARRCDPCHNPGGRMYERLPFDDASVVASHREGVARRLKDPEDKAAFESWLKTRPDDGS